MAGHHSIQRRLRMMLRTATLAAALHNRPVPADSSGVPVSVPASTGVGAGAVVAISGGQVVIPAAVLDVPAAALACNTPSIRPSAGTVATAPPAAHVPPLQQCIRPMPAVAGLGLLPMAGISNPAMHLATVQIAATRVPGTCQVCGHLARLGHYGRLHTQRGRDTNTALLQGQLICPIPESERRGFGGSQSVEPVGVGQKRKRWDGLCDCSFCAADLRNRK
jgi:hypothetical protein